MKAAVLTKYGAAKHIVVKEIDKPTINDDELLVKIHASSVTAGDCSIRRLDFPFLLKLGLRIYLGFLKPRKLILGQEISGEVVEVGKDIQRFKVGDRVFGTTGFKFGGCAEFISLKENSSMSALSVMPSNASFEAAAGLPTGGLEAVHFIRKANLKKGDKILINGAGGSIGTISIQLAKYIGAEVTAIDSGDKLEMLKQAGADFTIDYIREDFTGNGKKYDVIFDVIGKSNFNRSVNSLTINGSYVFSDWKLSHKWQNQLMSNRNNLTVIFGGTQQSIQNLEYLKTLYEKGKIVTIIDKVMLLEEIVEAHIYVDEGKKKGNLIINVK